MDAKDMFFGQNWVEQFATALRNYNGDNLERNIDNFGTATLWATFMWADTEQRHRVWCERDSAIGDEYRSIMTR